MTCCCGQEAWCPVHCSYPDPRPIRKSATASDQLWHALNVLSEIEGACEGAHQAGALLAGLEKEHEAALTAARDDGQPKWQPIETAPRDGTDLLLLWLWPQPWIQMGPRQTYYEPGEGPTYWQPMPSMEPPQ